MTDKRLKITNGNFNIMEWIQFHNSIPFIFSLIALIGFIYAIKATADTAFNSLQEVKQQHMMIIEKEDNALNRITAIEQYIKDKGVR